jgi:hypothetical protein
LNDTVNQLVEALEVIFSISTKYWVKYAKWLWKILVYKIFEKSPENCRWERERKGTLLLFLLLTRIFLLNFFF